MNLKKVLTSVSMVALGTIMLSACNSSSQNSSSSEEGKTVITFWAAPNPTQLKYWQDMADEFEKSNPDIVVDVSQMKESPSSEATIQSAIASNTTPTLSENINRSFAAQLAESKAILPLNQQSNFETIIENRNMTQSIAGWEFSDGNQYVLPVYSNPILFAWRLDILEELGFNDAPKTYSELLTIGSKLLDEKNDVALWAKRDLNDPTAWMRWFDFFPLYDAASQGAPFVEDNKFVADETAIEEVFTLMGQLAEEKLLRTGEATDPFENGDSLMTDLGPWTFPNWEEKYPELIFGENYTVTTPVVPDELKDLENISTYADAKGIVMYKQATTEEQEAAMKFLDFVYSDEQHDMSWLEVTNLIPARDDATENDAFMEYFEENPAMEIFAQNVPYAVPAIDNEKYNDIQQVFGEKAWVPVIRGEKDPSSAVKDGKVAIEGVLQ